MTLAFSWTILAFMKVIGGTQIYFHSSDPAVSPWPYQVAAGGRTHDPGSGGIVDRKYHQHTLILTLSGEGWIRVGDREVAAEEACLAWLDTSRTYAHRATPGNHWSYVWIALSGATLDNFFMQLNLRAEPVVDEMADLLPDFEGIIQQLASQHPLMDAHMNTQVAAILAKVFTKRAGTPPLNEVDPVSKVIQQLRKDLSRNWDITAMAVVAGLSQSQLFRRFQAATETSPVSWLRRERMVQAEHLLTVSSENVSAVAQRCGYADPFHFSRDFKRHCGRSPTAFRENARF
ncbi:AraC family transcriptional regulator [Roseibium sp. SCP14]|uniref:AraC family transcriptional regulator n=1 Tax=Roseibium sp. SCP14 TaxID=3141375 RepID=UPI0033369E10